MNRSSGTNLGRNIRRKDGWNFRFISSVSEEETSLKYTLSFFYIRGGTNMNMLTGWAVVTVGHNEGIPEPDFHLGKWLLLTREELVIQTRKFWSRTV